MIEDDDEITGNVNSITIFPPQSTLGNITDEYSGEEDSVNMNSLPSSLLHASAEINLRLSSVNDDDFSSEDSVPLQTCSKKISSSQLKSQPKKKRRVDKSKYVWVNKDLTTQKRSSFDSYQNFEKKVH